VAGKLSTIGLLASLVDGSRRRERLDCGDDVDLQKDNRQGAPHLRDCPRKIRQGQGCRPAHSLFRGGGQTTWDEVLSRFLERPSRGHPNGRSPPKIDPIAPFRTGGCQIGDSILRINSIA